LYRITVFLKIFNLNWNKCSKTKIMPNFSQFGNFTCSKISWIFLSRAVKCPTNNSAISRMCSRISWFLFPWFLRSDNSHFSPATRILHYKIVFEFQHKDLKICHVTLRLTLFIPMWYLVSLFNPPTKWDCQIVFEWYLGFF
jgi:hypothetical protein